MTPARFFAYRLIPRDYITLVFEGRPCTMRPVEACEQLKNSETPAAYSVIPRRMTEQAFDRMDEFNGW